MVGLVIVSHSAKLGEGVAELAAQVAGPDVRIGVAGGLEEPGALGTDAARVRTAVEEVWSGDGVLILMDLGSAVLSAELALDLMEDERRAQVRLTAAPLVEGAVAAAVSAGLGDPLDMVARAAREALAAKQEHVDEPADDGAHAAEEAEGSGEAAGGERSGPVAGGGESPGAMAGGGEPPEPTTTTVVVRNRLGLHARPAALLVRTLAPLDARVDLSVPARRRGPADARSLTAVGALGVRAYDEVLVRAQGSQAAEALDAVRRLATEGFGEPEDLVPRPAAAQEPPAEARPIHGPADDGLADEGPAEEAPLRAGAVLRGVPAAPGIGEGPAHLVVAQVVAPPGAGGRPGVRRALTTPPGAPSTPAGDSGAEWLALGAARAAAARDLRAARAALAGRVGAHDAEIFDAHLLLVDDPGLLEPARAAVYERAEPAARAWADAVESAAAAWEALDDPYQRLRARDVREVGGRVLDHLTSGAAQRGPDERGEAGESAAGTPAAPPVIVVTDELTPADVAAFSPGAVAGVACAGGGPTAHGVILARALGIPVVVGVGAALLALDEGDLLLVDGDEGAVTVRPPDGVLAGAREKRREREREASAAAVRTAEPAVTLDGVTIAVEANIGAPEEAEAAVAAGADGVGLLRTEFLFHKASGLPDEAEQAAAYGAIAAALNGRQLTIRTLDAGADKPLPALRLPPEANPFLGVRGLRLGLRYPDQLSCQLRAALLTAGAHPVRIMFPMVAEAAELRRARGLLDDARAELVARGAPVPAHLDVGVMLEVPSAALLAERLAPLVDFFSVGTNDLTQYTMAAERGNAGVAALADPLHPAVLRLIERTARAAGAAGRALAVCGEAGGDPAAVPLLLGLGVRELSMSPVRIAAAKQAVRRTDLAAARRLAERALEAESAADVRRLLAAAGTRQPAPP